MNTKYRFITTYPEKISSICRVCKKESQKSFQLYQKYFVLLGLPLFPTQQIVYWNCDSCSVQKEVKIVALNTLDNWEEEIAQSLKMKFPSNKSIRYYWGSILILSILALIITSILSD
jgi:hypothetical protein